jgi:hypothetical protein
MPPACRLPLSACRLTSVGIPTAALAVASASVVAPTAALAAPTAAVGAPTAPSRGTDSGSRCSLCVNRHADSRSRHADCGNRHTDRGNLRFSRLDRHSDRCSRHSDRCSRRTDRVSRHSAGRDPAALRVGAPSGGTTTGVPEGSHSALDCELGVPGHRGPLSCATGPGDMPRGRWRLLHRGVQARFSVELSMFAPRSITEPLRASLSGATARRSPDVAA